MRNWRTFIVMGTLILLAALAFSTAQAQDVTEKRFPGDITVSGPFLAFYDAAPDPEFLFGQPISKVMELDNKQVQFFERARFELEATSHGYQVKLAPLGWTMFDETKPAPSVLPNGLADCRTFSNGHRVCLKMLDFYEAYDGAVYFGNPVSDLIYRDGKMVQYFQYARFEWRPNNPDFEVGLTDVGRLSYATLVGWNLPSSPGIGLAGLSTADFKARAFVSQALVPPGAGNTLFVVVQTPDLLPVEGASVQVTLQVGQEHSDYPVAYSDKDGIVQLDVPVLDLAPNQVVQLEVTVQHGEKTVKTSTWFRAWY